MDLCVWVCMCVGVSVLKQLITLQADRHKLLLTHLDTQWVWTHGVGHDHVVSGWVWVCAWVGLGVGGYGHVHPPTPTHPPAHPPIHPPTHIRTRTHSFSHDQTPAHLQTHMHVQT